MSHVQQFQELKGINDSWEKKKQLFKDICDKLKNDFEANGFHELISLNDDGAIILIANKKFKLKFQSDFIMEGYPPLASIQNKSINLKMILLEITDKKEFGIEIEKEIQKYTVDTLGNINGDYTKNDFSIYLLNNLFNYLFKLSK